MATKKTTTKKATTETAKKAAPKKATTAKLATAAPVGNPGMSGAHTNKSFDHWDEDTKAAFRV